MSNEKDMVGARLWTEFSPVELSGPFDFGLALARLSIDDFHRRSYLGEFLRQLKNEPTEAAVEIIGSLIIKAITDHPFPRLPDLLVTIPDTVSGRPFSPNARLADRIAAHFDCLARHDVIRLRNKVTPQKNRSLEQRRDDHEARYEVVSDNPLRDKSVLLFDDIYASGQSMNEAAELVRTCQPSYLTVMTIISLY